MKVLLVGNGAREHVAAEAIARDAELYTVMSKRNPAIARLAKKHWICNIESAEEVKKVLALENEKFDIGFSSPDATLAAGVSDVLAEFCSGVASPSRNASRIEWDKSYARNLMNNHDIPGLPSHKVTTYEREAEDFIKDIGEVAVKPIGLTGGKGVKIMGEHLDEETAVQYAYELIKRDGSVLLEEKLKGEEFTLQAFCDGEHIVFMPPVQDHKRAFEDDRGPNTGGMGSYSTGKNLPFLTDVDLERAKEIMRKTIDAMKREGNPYKGILYGQFMAGKDEVNVIEFNARFGDPEAMNVVPLIKNSFTGILRKIVEGNLNKVEFEEKNTVVKYLVPDGYPTNPKKNEEVKVDEEILKKSRARIYYASVYEENRMILTTGSRAFGVLGIAENLEDAEKIAEEGCRSVSGPLWRRPDIGTRALVDKRKEHMDRLRRL